MSNTQKFKLQSSMFATLLCVGCGHAESLPANAASSSVSNGERGGLGYSPPPDGGILGEPVSSMASKAPANGRLEPKVIQTIVRSNFNVMRKCYEEGLRRDPNLQGPITTRFVIEIDGRVSSAAPTPQAKPEEPRLPDAKVVACVVGAFMTLTFPKPEGGIVTVVYPIVFNPGEADK
jgi:hypothetical protein